jgi:hypothetical protein
MGKACITLQTAINTKDALRRGIGKVRALFNGMMGQVLSELGFAINFVEKELIAKLMEIR